MQQGNAEGFAYVVQHPLETVAGFLIYAGSAFDLFPALPQKLRYYLPFVAGLILVAGLAYWLGVQFPRLLLRLLRRRLAIPSA